MTLATGFLRHRIHTIGLAQNFQSGQLGQSLGIAQIFTYSDADLVKVRGVWSSWLPILSTSIGAPDIVDPFPKQLEADKLRPHNS